MKEEEEHHMGGDMYGCIGGRLEKDKKKREMEPPNTYNGLNDKARHRFKGEIRKRC